MSDTITMTREELQDTIKTTVKDTLAELNIKGYPMQSGRIYRKTMVETVGRVRYDEAVRKGWLFVQKHDPMKTTSRVYARREDWGRFLKLHTNKKK